MFAKAKWRMMGNAASKEFWAIGGTDFENRTVYALKDSSGKLRKKGPEIADVAREFYETLFGREETDANAQEKILSLIKGYDFSGVEGPVTQEEIETVVEKWERGKVPGPDGIPYEFFKAFLEAEIEMEPMTPAATNEQRTFVDVLRAVCTILMCPDRYGQRMKRDWAKSCIKVMYKAGEVTDMKNYRPLSMTNAIYKLFTSVVNNRLIGPCAYCVGMHQTGFMPGRKIYDNVKLAQMLIDRAEQTKTPLFLALLDQEKAYDRVDHKYLWRVLEKFGVPYPLRVAIEGCYQSAESVVSINGYVSNAIKITRGVRQGDPLSCLLFNLAIKPFALLLLETEKIPGYKDMGGTTHKVSMYADDTAVVLTDHRQWRELAAKYKIYGKASGGRLNIAKCVLVAAGISEAVDSKSVRVSWKVPEKYLGVPIGVGLETSPLWAKLHAKIRAKIKQWEFFYLSIRQRIAVTRQCMQSVLWYHLRCLDARKTDIEPIQRSVLRYIWALDENAKTIGPIKRTQASRPIEEGGLYIMDTEIMRRSLALSWIRALQVETEKEKSRRPGWVLMFREVLFEGEIGGRNEKLQRPWEQLWTGKTPPPSINHFWRWWKDYLPSPIPPNNKNDLYQTSFWHHPSLNNRKYRPRLNTPIWNRLFEEDPCGILTVGKVWDLAKGYRPAPPGVQAAARRAVANYPELWTTLLERQIDPQVQQGVIRAHGGVYSEMEGKHYSLQAPNKALYKSILRDLVESNDLLKIFKDQCSLDGVSLEGYKDEDIWRGIRHKNVDYSKVTDLYWKLLHMCVRTGESWMPHPDCDICKETQTARHLFWDCSAAQMLRDAVGALIREITGEVPPHINTFSRLLLSGIYRGKEGTFKDRESHWRWRVLLGETLWVIWKYRCEYSFGDAPDFNPKALLRRWRAAVHLRIETDLLLAQDLTVRKRGEPRFSEIWRFKHDVAKRPKWLDSLRKVRDGP